MCVEHSDTYPPMYVSSLFTAVFFPLPIHFDICYRYLMMPTSLVRVVSFSTTSSDSLVRFLHLYLVQFVDLMLTNRNAIIRHFVRWAINSAQSPIGRNIAVIWHRYAICVVDINVNHVHRQNISVSQCCQEPLGIIVHFQ